MSNVQLNSRTGAIALSDRVGRISVSSTLAVMMEAEKLRAEGADIVDFGAGEPDFPTPDNVKEAAIRAIRDNFSKYTATPGTMELRQAIVDWHRRELGTSYSPSEVIATAGGKQATRSARHDVQGAERAQLRRRPRPAVGRGPRHRHVAARHAGAQPSRRYPQGVCK